MFPYMQMCQHLIEIGFAFYLRRSWNMLDFNLTNLPRDHLILVVRQGF